MEASFSMGGAIDVTHVLLAAIARYRQATESYHAAASEFDDARRTLSLRLQDAGPEGVEQLGWRYFYDSEQGVRAIDLLRKNSCAPSFASLTVESPGTLSWKEVM